MHPAFLESCHQQFHVTAKLCREAVRPQTAVRPQIQPLVITSQRFLGNTSVKRAKSTIGNVLQSLYSFRLYTQRHGHVSTTPIAWSFVRGSRVAPPITNWKAQYRCLFLHSTICKEPLLNCWTVNLIWVFQLYTCFPGSLIKTALVCKSWHFLSQRIIDFHIGLTISPKQDSRNKNIFGRLQTDEDYRKRVRRITVEDWFCSGELPLQGLFKDKPVPQELLPNSRRFNKSLHSNREPRAEETWGQINALAKLIPELCLIRFRYARITEIHG